MKSIHFTRNESRQAIQKLYTRRVQWYLGLLPELPYRYGLTISMVTHKWGVMDIKDRLSLVGDAKTLHILDRLNSLAALTWARENNLGEYDQEEIEELYACSEQDWWLWMHGLTEEEHARFLKSDDRC
jgi:hypothetical protein